MTQISTPESTPRESLEDKQVEESNRGIPHDVGETPGTMSNTFNHDHVFDDPRLGKYFVPITEYEGMHRFDPKATWTKAEEKTLVRKLDRGNISAALSDNLLNDLGLNTNDYNNGQMIFYLSFMCAELPSQLVSKRLGPDVWLPIQLSVGFSIFGAMAQCKLNSRESFFATRCLLGLLEGGFIPDIILFLSYFYKGNELPIRLAFFWMSYTFTDISGALFGSGILQMRGIHGWEGWRYLFLIEGAVSAAVGVFSFFWLPASPTQTKGILRGKDGWFTEREEVIMVNRILQDDPSKGGMHNRQGLHLSDFWASIMDYDNWGLYLIGICAYIPPTPPTAYMTLTLRNLGFNTLNSNLLTIPYSVLFMMNNFLLTQLSCITKERSIVSSLGNIWQLPFLIALSVLPDNANGWVRYTLLTLLLSYPYSHPIVVAWNSQNSNTVRTRTVSAALYNIFGQAGSIISTHIYNENDKPFYHKGNKVLVGITVWNILLFYLVKLYYIQRNKWKAARWNAMSTAERAHYLETTTDKGNKRLDFVFVH
ncbi:putative transporter YIL166C [Saccharomyces cerevisiae S288c] [Rhizoctonia solani]|uniref:Putative transporter YIL166C [Saccharomyces cerevisiae S288c] n=1 Tax=Rhizoctonia solani TaxID=456999 RepID=A0A0K6GIM3_9AGAM|nr:putative transporter YIL166C [Saccharomyces cerevisiae S288c] [Rhizoctonia solani]